MKAKLETLSVSVLREFAKDKNIKNISTMRKSELIEAIIAAAEGEEKNEPAEVASVVADYFDVTVENFLSSARVQAISNARAIVCYIAREHLQLSYESIGNFLNKKHQTVMYSAEKIKKALKTNKELEKDLNKILKKLGL